MIRSKLWVFCLALAIAGCSSAYADPPHQQAAPQRQVAAPTAAARPAPTPTPSGRAARVRYDLAHHVARAELRFGTTLVEDFGVAGGSKYTLGGWLTNTGEDRVVDGTSAMLLPGSSAKITVPSESTEAATITIRARTFRADTVRFYVNGTERGNAAFTGREFETIHLTLPAGVLSRGENVLQLRASGVVSVAGGGRASVALDWLALSAAPLPDTFAPPAPDALMTTASTESALHVPAGWSLGYAFEVPDHARLRFAAKGGASARAEVTIVRDDGAPVALPPTQASTNGTPADLDLNAYSGQIVRVDVRTNGGEAAIVNPQIVTLDATVAATAPRPTNVLVYLIDTMRADKLRPINPESRVQTPGLTQFVEGAAIMMGAHTQENWTKPSVATLLSSLMPWQHNAITTEAVVPQSVRLAPEILSDHGFYTGAFIANGYVSDRFGFRQGWTTYRNYVREGRNTPAQFVAADVLSWLDGRPAEKPFFLYVHTIDPHVPYRPPHQFLSMYDAQAYNGVVDFTHDGALLEKIKIGQVQLNARDRVHLQALV
jgi:choline-sulfatase